MRAAILLLAIACGWARAQTVRLLVNNGDPANRIDLVMLGDGYTAAEANRFYSDANRFLSTFFGDEVYREYATYFNVRTVTVPSNQSGASHSEWNPPVFRDTAFSAAYNCGGVPRLICVNNVRVTTLLNTLLPANQRDYVIVLVNDSTYGGAGGALMVSSTHEQSVEIGLHESGHSIGLLADEYSDSPPVCDLGHEPIAANSTIATDRARVKWNAWIDHATAVPTMIPALGRPGVFEGSDYCWYGKYRPTYNSKMRALGNPFDAVNAEQLVRRFYNLVSGIDEVSPRDGSLSVVQGSKAEFRMTPLAPVSHALTVLWTVDGVPHGGGTSLIIDSSKLSQGVHTVKVHVQDVTSWVRSDPQNLLSDSQTWQLNVAAEMPAAPGTGLRPSIASVMGAALSVPAVQVLAPGGLFSVFGAEFMAGGARRPVASTDLVRDALPQNLAQTCVQVGNSRAPLTFVSATQINAIAPPVLGPGRVAISVIADCGTAGEKASDPIMVTVASAAPEFLYARWAADGRNPVSAVHAITGEPVSAARAGDTLTIFGIGFGPTTSAAAPGTIAMSAAETLGAARVTIGGVDAQVLYSGVTPLFAGLYQVNLIVPVGIGGGAQPVMIEVNGGMSPGGAYLMVGQ